jgi:hypothetical protein
VRSEQHLLLKYAESDCESTFGGPFHVSGVSCMLKCMRIGRVTPIQHQNQLQSLHSRATAKSMGNDRTHSAKNRGIQQHALSRACSFKSANLHARTVGQQETCRRGRCQHAAMGGGGRAHLLTAMSTEGRRGERAARANFLCHNFFSSWKWFKLLFLPT